MVFQTCIMTKKGHMKYQTKWSTIVQNPRFKDWRSDIVVENK